MRSFGIFASVILLLSAQISPAQATAISDFDMAKLTDEADLIIEGKTLDESARDDRRLPIYVDNSKQSITVGYGTVNLTEFLVEKTYKGLNPKDQVTIFSYPKIDRAIVKLKPNRKYVLFLKKHPNKNGYMILNSGRGQWMVFEHNSTKKVKAWNQTLTLRHSDTYQDYHDMIQQLQTQLLNESAKSLSN